MNTKNKTCIQEYFKKRVVSSVSKLRRYEIDRINVKHWYYIVYPYKICILSDINKI